MLCAGLTILAMACSDDKDKKETNSGSNTPSCVASCKDNVLTTCDANGTPKTEPCTTGCNADGVTCSAPSCVASCKDNVLTTCDANGNPKTEPCTTGCNTDGVTCSTPSCVASCKDNVLTTCDANGNPKTEPCTTGCNTDGITCKEEQQNDNIDKDILPVPEDQNNEQEALCNPGTFVDHCDGNTQIYCAYNGTYDSYQVSYLDCDEDTFCIVSLETNGSGNKVNYTNCLAACDQNTGTVRKECSTDSYDDSEILSTYTCVNSSKGKVWYDVIEHCASECTEAECAEKDKACEGTEEKCGADNNIVACVDGIVHYTSCTRDGMVCGESHGAIGCGSF